MLELGDTLLKFVKESTTQKNIEKEALQKAEMEKKRFKLMNLGELVRTKKGYTRLKRRIGIYANSPMLPWQKRLIIRIYNDLLRELESLIINHGKISQ